MNFIKHLLVMLLLVAGTATASASVTLRGKAVAIVDGTECPEAAKVCVTNTADEPIVWHESPYTNDGRTIANGNMTLHYDFTLVFRVQPAEGYRFIGWSTGKKGTTIASTETTYEWSGTNGMSSITTKTYYAILEKTDATEPADLGDGVALKNIGGTTEYVEGSTSIDWAVRLIFNEPLAFKDIPSYSTNYGVNETLIKFVTCKCGDNTIKPSSVGISGSIAADGADTYGLLKLPPNMPLGTYTVHLPYGLYTTKSGRVTAAADFEVKVVANTSPFILVSNTPTDGSTWQCKEDADDFSGFDVSITLKFNKTIADVTALGKATKLISDYGAAYPTERITIGPRDLTSVTFNYGRLPNGSYRFDLPKGAIISTQNEENAEKSISFNVKNSSTAKWELRTYTTVTASLANNSAVEKLENITFEMSREGFAAPKSLKPGHGNVTAVRITEVFEEGVDYSSPEVQPTIVSEDIAGVKASVKDGKLSVDFTQPVTEKGKIVISVPAGMVINLSSTSGMTAQQLFEAGGCTNSAIQRTINVVPDYNPGTPTTTPFVLAATTPAEGGIWDAATDGDDVSVKLTFNQPVASTTSDLSSIILQGSTTHTATAIGTYIDDTKSVSLHFGVVPNGTYTLSVPAGAITAADGQASPTATLHFSVTGQKDETLWLPTYKNVSVDPADGSKIRSLSNVAISLTDDDYDAPIGLMPATLIGGAITAKHTNAKGTTEINGITPSVKDGKLCLTFDTPITTPGTVQISIPAGMTNNVLAPIALMTKEEIIEEGGCTNPAITLTYSIVATELAVRDVTGIGYDTTWETDADGNYVKDENGHYIRTDKYDSLVDAQLTPQDAVTGEGDRVTVMYFWFDEEFETINYTGGASVTNITTGLPRDIASISFKTGGDDYRNNVIEMRLSIDSYIYSSEYDQGVYEVILPAGIATTADGVHNACYTFRFTYGDPAKAQIRTAADVSEYLGHYMAVSEEGETDASDESFDVIKVGDSYYITHLCGTDLMIPIVQQGINYVLQQTESDNEAFMRYGNAGDVEIMFQSNETGHYIYIDAYALYVDDLEPFYGGIINFQLMGPSTTIEHPTTTDCTRSAIYDLSGRHTNRSGIIIRNGQKQLHGTK